MGSELVLKDHRALQFAVARTSLAGAAAGLVHALHPGALTDVLGLFGLGVAAVVPRSARAWAMVSALACLGAGAAMVAGGSTLGAAAFGLCGALLFAREARSWPRRLVSLGVGAAALGAGLFVAAGLQGGLLHDVAPALGWMVAGGAAGFVAGFGVLGRELSLQPVLAGPAGATGALAAPLPEPTGELGELIGRAAQACRQAEEALGEEAPHAARAAQDLVGRIGVFSLRWRGIERQMAGSDRAALVERMERMAARAQATGDEVVRAEYLRAERALHQQLADLDAIRGWQERALARLHHHVAVLERLRLAALHRRSVDTGRSGEELGTLVEELGAASMDLDGAAEAMAELPASA